jgi:hypothetical protein
VLVGPERYADDAATRGERAGRRPIVDERCTGGGTPNVSDGLTARAEHQGAAVHRYERCGRLRLVRLADADEIEKAIIVHAMQFSRASHPTPAPIGGTAARRQEVHLFGGLAGGGHPFTPVMTDQIDFVCVRPDHQVTTLGEALTVHAEKWAYCPSAHHDGHAWRACGGLGLDDLKRLLQRFPVTRIASAG